jgi:hypothetical protein
MSDETRRIHKEVAVACFRYYTRIFLGGLRKTKENLRIVGDQTHSKWGPQEYEIVISATTQACSPPSHLSNGYRVIFPRV